VALRAVVCAVVALPAALAASCLLVDVAAVVAGPLPPPQAARTPTASAAVNWAVPRRRARRVVRADGLVTGTLSLPMGGLSFLR